MQHVVTANSCRLSLTASVVSCMNPSLPPGQPVPIWIRGGTYLSASAILFCCDLLHSSASGLSVSIHAACSLSASSSTLSWTTSYQPSFPSSLLANCFLLLLSSCILWSIFPTRRARISSILHAAPSTNRSLRYTAWPRPDPRLSENRSAWLCFSSMRQSSLVVDAVSPHVDRDLLLFGLHLKFTVLSKNHKSVSSS